MKSLSYLAIGILFGITMLKSEAASWFRIYEMFQFQSFHMYGIIGVSVVLGVLITALIKKYKIKAFDGSSIEFNDKDYSIKRYLFGGILFGLGWALSGACPGPMFTLAGAGFLPILIVIVFAVFGTYLYGVLKDKLPH
ncbi:DUF6691 family protein [Flavicella sediminum]|uniref:DUF6691 family protein n=1 Tax=Flavicella sediminum TaxID=2585141 RepID=UPI00111DE75E|nr:DUF6691 family protein [Flavicella sediminum]